MRTYNKVELKGRIHSYALETKETEKGEAITGTVTLEVAENGTTVDARFFAYPTYNSGKTNKTYEKLESLMGEEYKTIVRDGDEADWLAIDATVAPDYFVGRDGAQTVDDLNHSQKIRGSFINPNKNHDYSNFWKCDMLITRVEDIEADDEKHRPHAARVHGYIIDDYNNRVMGVQFDALDEAPINYLLGLDVSKDAPLYTAIKGEFRQIKTLITREGAFGEAEQIEYDNLRTAITWMPKDTYEFGSDITKEQYGVFMDRLEEYKKSKLNAAANDEADNLVF